MTSGLGPRIWFCVRLSDLKIQKRVPGATVSMLSAFLRSYYRLEIGCSSTTTAFPPFIVDHFGATVYKSHCYPSTVIVIVMVDVMVLVVMKMAVVVIVVVLVVAVVVMAIEGVVIAVGIK